MKKNKELSSKTLLIIAVIAFILRILIGGMVGGGFGLIGFICLIFGLMKLYKEKKLYKNSKAEKKVFQEIPINKIRPPKTDKNNFLFIPHITELVEYFITHEQQISLVNSECVVHLFETGYSPKVSKDDFNNPLKIKEIDDKAKINTPKKWLVVRLWLGLSYFNNLSKKTSVPMEKLLKDYIEFLGNITSKSLVIFGGISVKYKLDDLSNVNWEKEIKKITDNEERENFKINYVFDTIISSEMRILAWIYKELFNKNLSLKN